jgi:hypothetical protein
MKTAPADGSTLLLTPMSMLGIYPHIYKKLQYDPLKDLITLLAFASLAHCEVSPRYRSSASPELLMKD